MYMNVLVGQSDCFQGHEHLVPFFNNSGNMRDGGSRTSNPNSPEKTTTIVTDNVHGEPRIGNETRSINFTYKVWKRTN